MVQDVVAERDHSVDSFGHLCRQAGLRQTHMVCGDSTLRCRTRRLRADEMRQLSMGFTFSLAHLGQVGGGGGGSGICHPLQ
jgi:hypothetical protein